MKDQFFSKIDFNLIDFFFGYIHTFGNFPTFWIRCKIYYQGICVRIRVCARTLGTHPLKMDPTTDPKRWETTEDMDKSKKEQNFIHKSIKALTRF